LGYGLSKRYCFKQGKFSELQNNKYIRHENLPLKTALGNLIKVEYISNVYLVDNSKVIQCNIYDISDRKKLEDIAKDKALGRESLLKEVHHRIKNNINIISSLLSFQSQTISEPSAIKALEDANSRVQSMGILYDKLYSSADFSELSINVYLSPLIDEILSNFSNSNKVNVEKNIESFMMDAKRLQPLGIIISELITNIMKYAFKRRKSGLITVSAINNDGYNAIIIKNNGNGMPKAISFENSTGFGLQLVQALTNQLDGSLRIERENGTKVIIEFEK